MAKKGVNRRWYKTRRSVKGMEVTRGISRNVFLGGKQTRAVYVKAILRSKPGTPIEYDQGHVNEKMGK